MAEAELFKHVNVTTPDMVGRNRMAAAIKVTASVFWIRDVAVSISRISANNIYDNYSFLNVLNVENLIYTAILYRVEQETSRDIPVMKTGSLQW